MKVFTMRVAMVAGQPTTKDVTLNMSIDEIKLCLSALQVSKVPSNEVLKSLRENLIHELTEIK